MTEMTETANTEGTTTKETTKTSKKGLLLTVLIVSLALGSGIGGTWYVIQDQTAADGTAEPKKKPITFVELEAFTVNLQPEEKDYYFQVGLTIKTEKTKIVGAIKDQMPEIRNRLLLLLSSKKASEISTIIGKQQLSTEITHEIRQVFDSEEMQKEIVGVLFTSFVIQ